MNNPFKKIAERTYIRFEKFFSQRQEPITAQTLCGLYPLEDRAVLYRDYQVKKLAATMLLLFIGAVSLLGFGLYGKLGSRAIPEAKLARREWSEGAYGTALKMEIAEFAKEISFNVRAREPTAEEKVRMRKELEEILPERIRGENSDLQHVIHNLELVSSLEDYPFSIQWFSQNPELVSHRGELDQSLVKEGGETTVLTAILSGDKEKYRLEYEICVLPRELTRQEQLTYAVESALQKADEESRENTEILLPEWVNGEAVVWKTVKKDGGILIGILLLVAAPFTGKALDHDLEKARRRREESLERDYPEFVGKLRLYLSAGLTLKNVFIKLAQDSRGDKKYLSEELQVACNQFKNGVMEETVYREWGKRCGGMRYRRLSFLLSIYLKHGSDQLLKILSQEADRAQEDQRNMARKAGEEAGTKLLLPMLLMMAVVICLVLLPAYLDFGNV